MLKLYNNDSSTYYANRSVKNESLKKPKPAKDITLNKSEKTVPKKNIKPDSNKLPPISKQDRRVQRNNLKNSALKANNRQNLEPIKHIPVDESRFKSRGWNKTPSGASTNDTGASIGSKTKAKLKHLEPLKVDPKRDAKRKKNGRRNVLTKITRETAVVYNSKPKNRPGRKIPDDKPKPVNKLKIFVRQETYRVLEPKYVKGPNYGGLSRQDADVDETLDRLKIFRLDDDVDTYAKDIFGSPVFMSKVYDSKDGWNDLFGKKNDTPPPSYERAMERYELLNRSKLYLNQALKNLDDSHVRLNNIFKNIENTKRRTKTRTNRVKSNELD